MKKILIIFLSLLSFSVTADTVPAVGTTWYFAGFMNNQYSTADLACKSHGSSVKYTNGACYAYNVSTGSWTTFNDNVIQLMTCATGTLSGSMCINAASCISPQQRNLTTYQCYTPVECKYPETDNGSGACADNTCPSGQVQNPTTKSCQTKPVCGSTETYDIYSNTCKLYPLNCPGHSHANTANDKCLADAPNACPIGQHDDGTYTCVANDAVACKSNQQSGYIFGVPQCIGKANVDEFAKQAADAAANRAVKSQAEQAALAAKQAADAALAADPSNTTKQAASTTATSNYTSSQTATSAAVTAEKNTKDTTDTQLLATIAKNTQDANNKDDAVAASGFASLPAPDTINKRNVAIDSSVGNFTASGTCPAPQTLTLRLGTVTWSNQMYCDFASSISVFVLGMAWLGAGFIVFKGA